MKNEISRAEFFRSGEVRMHAFLFLMALISSNLVPAAERGEATGNPGGVADYESLVKPFEYDSMAPLDVEETGRDDITEYGAVIHHVAFASPVEGRITASLVAPKAADAAAGGSRKSRYAGIVFMHWGQGNRTEFLWEAALYAKAGAVSISIDAPWARPAPWTQASEGSVDRPELLTRMYAQTVIDVRRAVDLLVARGDVDPGRIAYVGHSFGATWGGVLAGVDKRFKTFILMGGLPTLADLSPQGLPSMDAYSETLKRYLTAEQLKRYIDALEPMSGVLFIGHAAPASILMQFARFDSWISKRAADAYFDAASDPKEIRWYPTSHEFGDPRALADRAEWLEKEIGISHAVSTIEHPPRTE
jgi:cephalosporin-C deacetylase-like acetyl esterase